MNKRVLALGRMKAGAMNKTEAAYATTLEAARNAQEIIWYAFEGVTLSSQMDAATRLILPFYGLMASWRCTRSKATGPTMHV